jgi:hypothetical protein
VSDWAANELLKNLGVPAPVSNLHGMPLMLSLLTSRWCRRGCSRAKSQQWPQPGQKYGMPVNL